MSNSYSSLEISPNYTHREFGWSDAEGTNLAVTQWGNASQKGGPCLVLVHGHGEHIGRYAHFISKLGVPMSMIGYDHRGHGKSRWCSRGCSRD